MLNENKGECYIPVGTINSSTSGSGIGLIMGTIIGTSKGIKLNRN
jgi:hypothetical protein